MNRRKEVSLPVEVVERLQIQAEEEGRSLKNHMERILILNAKI